MTRSGEVCIVVPGIGGSVLKDGVSTVWDVSDRSFLRYLLTQGEPFERLTLRAPEQDDGIAATGLIRGATIFPGVWNYGDYRPLTRELERRFDRVLGFPYDWRRSCAVNATALKRAVDAASGNRVVLVAHSIGGLIARRYLACESGAERCSLLVTLGTPYRGAAKAIGAITHGVAKLAGRTGERLHQLLRSLPSVHELLPVYDCVLDQNGGLAALATAIASTDLVVAAADFHEETRLAVERLGGQMPPTLAVVGQHQRTPTFVRRAPGGELEVVSSGGDGTVPRGSAQPPEWGDDPTRAHVVTGRHVDLPAHAPMHEIIGAALDGRQYLRLGHDTNYGLSVDIPDLASQGELVEVRATHPDDRLLLDVWVTDALQGTDQGHTELTNHGDGTYSTAIAGLAPGCYHVSVTGFADGEPQRVSELVTVLGDIF